jgi:hypothetical protein
MRPVARRDGLLIRELPDELLVYDQGQHRAHCLNRTAAEVYRHADGTRTVGELALLLAPEGDRAAGESAVEAALARLGEAGLLESAPAPPGLSRREVVRRIGIGAAILLPAVASVVAPTPAEAAATCVSSCASQPDGTPCTCFGANPCTATCVTGSCSDGGLC